MMGIKARPKTKTAPPAFRIEKDAIGERKVPAEAYYGISTLRALEIFTVSGERPHAKLIWAYACLKKAAALVNAELGTIPQHVGRAIAKACDEVLAGKLHEWFAVDIYGQGAGTSLHMNVNEVLANRAAEILGGRRGDHDKVDSHDHVNYGQSTNDTFPTATRLAVLAALRELEPALQKLEEAFFRKAKEFDSILKSARTHLQDAVPIRLGQEFRGYGSALQRAREALAPAKETLAEIALGATAAGTGINSAPGYRGKVLKRLVEETGLRLAPARDLCEGLQSHQALAAVSGALRNYALELIRITNDLRLLSSGPFTGLAEIQLPALIPGSSIMPGKVNPSVPEMMNMVCFEIIGVDTTVAMATQAGQLDLNVMTPVSAHRLLKGTDLFRNAIRVFTDGCVAGIVANRDRCMEFAGRSAALATALNNLIGYARSAEITNEAKRRGISILKLLEDPKFGTAKERSALADLKKLTEPP